MKNNQFRTPLMQSGALLTAIVFIFALIPSSETISATAGISSVFLWLLYALLFPFALVFSIIFSLTILIAIFLGAVTLYSPTQAAEIYSALKEKLSMYWQEGSTCVKANISKWFIAGVSEEEHIKIKNELAILYRKNNQLEIEISALRGENNDLQKMIQKLKTINPDNQHTAHPSISD